MVPYKVSQKLSSAAVMIGALRVNEVGQWKIKEIKHFNFPPKR